MGRREKRRRRRELLGSFGCTGEAIRAALELLGGLENSHYGPFRLELRVPTGASKAVSPVIRALACRSPFLRLDSSQWRTISLIFGLSLQDPQNLLGAEAEPSHDTSACGREKDEAS